VPDFKDSSNKTWQVAVGAGKEGDIYYRVASAESDEASSEPKTLGPNEQLTKPEDDASGITGRLDRYKRPVNVVNMVNVAERVLSYVTPNPAGHMPKRLWAFGMRPPCHRPFFGDCARREPSATRRLARANQAQAHRKHCFRIDRKPRGVNIVNSKRNNHHFSFEHDELPGCSTPRKHDSGCARCGQICPSNKS
jgi:hypothetical protein